jgi:hypothetical protein
VIRIESQGLDTLAADLTKAQAEIGPASAKVTGMACLNIKKDVQKRWSGLAHLPHLPRAISRRASWRGRRSTARRPAHPIRRSGRRRRRNNPRGRRSSTRSPPTLLNAAHRDRHRLLPVEPLVTPLPHRHPKDLEPVFGRPADARAIVVDLVADQIVARRGMDGPRLHER